jgi:hypothetical protein
MEVVVVWVRMCRDVIAHVWNYTLENTSLSV